MTKRIVCMIEKSPGAQAAIAKLEEHKKHIEQTISFLQKQAEAAKKKCDAAEELLWQELAEVLLDEEHVTHQNFNYARDTIGYNKDEGAVWVRKNGKIKGESDGIPDDLKTLLRNLLS